MDKENILNPEFATSTYYGKPSLTEAELKSILEKDSLIYRLFKKRGFISSRDYDFITQATFDEKITSELDGKWQGEKSLEEKRQARKMIKIVEDYFNSIYLDVGNINITSSLEPMEVVFLKRHDSECALYNGTKFSYNEINKILIEIFS